MASQSDLVRTFWDESDLKTRESDKFEQSLERHLRKASRWGQTGFLWALIRFRADGSLISVHHTGSSYSSKPEVELGDLLKESSEDGFRIFVRTVGGLAGLSADEISTLNRTWQIPDHVWLSLLDEDPVLYDLMSNQTRSISIDARQVYIPESASGKINSALIFLGHPNVVLHPSWASTFTSSEPERERLGLPDSRPAKAMGEYSLIAWLIDQAFQRQCASPSDFVFLCVEALLRPCVLVLGLRIQMQVELSFHTRRFKSPWSLDDLLEHSAILMICQDTIQGLPNWMSDHIGTKDSDDGAEFRARTLRQYELKIRQLERSIAFCKERLELGFAQKGAMMAEESISEMKFSKILTIIAIVYLPVSVASSIFGMNVQEINGQGVGIIWFVVTIFVTLAALLLCWSLFAYIATQRRKIKNLDSVEIRRMDYMWQGRPWKHRLFFVGWSRLRVRGWSERIRESQLAYKLHRLNRAIRGRNRSPVRSTPSILSWRSRDRDRESRSEVST